MKKREEKITHRLVVHKRQLSHIDAGITKNSLVSDDDQAGDQAAASSSSYVYLPSDTKTHDSVLSKISNFHAQLKDLNREICDKVVDVGVERRLVFEQSFSQLQGRSSSTWRKKFRIVFLGEQGQDAGGLLQEWYSIITKEIFNPERKLFIACSCDHTYTINPVSYDNCDHLRHFKFAGRVIAKAIYDNKLLKCYFTRSFYKHILGKPIRCDDLQSQDKSHYQGLVYLKEHDVKTVNPDLNFTTEVKEFGVTEVRDLKLNGSNILVTEENKEEYIELICHTKMTGAIKIQLKAFLEGFYDIIPKRVISVFNEQELELLISGLPEIDIDDLKSNTEYSEYQENCSQIEWFWTALRSFDQADRANFLQFITGTSRVPLQGFAALQGMNGTQKFRIRRDDRSTVRLPSAHTCFIQLDLPVYENYDKLKSKILQAIRYCPKALDWLNAENICCRVKKTITRPIHLFTSFLSKNCKM